jgi:hypothetical protein
LPYFGNITLWTFSRDIALKLQEVYFSVFKTYSGSITRLKPGSWLFVVFSFVFVYFLSFIQFNLENFTLLENLNRLVSVGINVIRSEILPCSNGMIYIYPFNICQQEYVVFHGSPCFLADLCCNIFSELWVFEWNYISHRLFYFICIYSGKYICRHY